MINFKIISTALISLSLISLTTNSIQAQSINDKEPNPYQSNEQNPLEGSSGINPMDLIHNANLLNLRNSSDFMEDTNKNLDTAASDFKKQQLQRMVEMQQQGQTANTDDSNSSISEQPE